MAKKKKSGNECETNNIGTDENKNKDEVKKNDGGKQQENISMLVVVLKIDLHCDGCASRLTKCIRSFKGVETVKAVDVDLNKLTVIGNLDPAKLRQMIEQKTKKKVEIISPVQKKEKESKNDGDGKENKNSGEKPANKSTEKKAKEPPVSTAVLKVPLHCAGCIQRIQKLVQKTAGYVDMSIDREKETVTVKGTMDMKALVSALKEKLKKPVEIIPAKKEGGDGGKKEKKEGDPAAGGGEKVAKVEENKMVQFGSHYEYGYPYVYDPGYVATHVHAPQLFSDENPNACVVM